MDLHLTLGRGRGLQAGVYLQLREAILDGRLRAGEGLPASRELAGRLGVSRNTVVHAYERLAAEGFLAGRVGAGTFVREGVAARSPRRAPAGALEPRAFFRALPHTAAAAGPAELDFQVGTPDPGLFPRDVWRRLVARQQRGRLRRVGYLPPEGDPRARAAIARQVGLSRSVRAGPDDVLLTSGAQQALDLVGRVLVEPGTCVAVEDPGYPPARRVFRSLGARVVPVPVDGEGLVVSALPADARLVYVTPSHQFPLGVAMSLARRQALLAWAERGGAAIVEDDYDSEFRFDGRPLEPLQSLDRHGRVIYVGSFSKVLLPTLRLGFLVAPAALQPALREAKALADGHGAPEAQRALAELMEDGLFARHVRRLVRIYRERRDRLAAAVERWLGAEVVVLPGHAGLHLALLLRDPRQDDVALARRALEAGVRVEPLRPYFEGVPHPGLALGYGLIPAARIEEGVRRLAAVVPRSANHRRRSRARPAVGAPPLPGSRPESGRPSGRE